MLFTGHYEHAIDAKQRLAIPADIRSRWRPEEHGSAWYAVPWPLPGDEFLIRLYTETHFTRLASTRSLSLTPDEDEAELQATLFGLAHRLEIDSAGRVRLPQDMLEMTSMPQQVALVGAGDRLEIRGRESWQQSRRDRLAKLPDLIRRIEARKAGGRGE